MVWHFKELQNADLMTRIGLPKYNENTLYYQKNSNTYSCNYLTYIASMTPSITGDFRDKDSLLIVEQIYLFCL